jgi:hypothetical protein
MAELRPVLESDVGAVCEFLGKNMHRGMKASEYRALFSYSWMEDKPGMGYLLEDGAEIVGFLGAIYSCRKIGGKMERFCNLTNWCVLPPFRNESLKLFFAVLGRPGQTIVNLSPSLEVQAMLTAMRYRPLDTFKLFSLPLTHFWTLAGRGRILQEGAELQAALDESQQEIIRHHSGTGCRFIVITEGQRTCLVVAKRRKKQGVPFTEILHASDSDLLRRNFERVKLSLMLRDRTPLLAIDERLLESRLPLMLPYRRPSFFQSRSVDPHFIDNLYSELALL